MFGNHYLIELKPRFSTIAWRKRFEWRHFCVLFF